MGIGYNTSRVEVVRGGAAVYGGVVQLALVPVYIGALQELRSQVLRICPSNFELTIHRYDSVSYHPFNFLGFLLDFRH